jgi:hypothetical protein
MFGRFERKQCFLFGFAALADMHLMATEPFSVSILDAIDVIDDEIPCSLDDHMTE